LGRFEGFRGSFAAVVIVLESPEVYYHGLGAKGTILLFACCLAIIAIITNQSCIYP
jgi:hypothetical protein